METSKYPWMGWHHVLLTQFARQKSTIQFKYNGQLHGRKVRCRTRTTQPKTKANSRNGFFKFSMFKPAPNDYYTDGAQIVGVSFGSCPAFDEIAPTQKVLIK